jgi:predicted double-glycine peptidase
MMLTACVGDVSDEALQGEPYRDRLHGSWHAARYDTVIEQDLDYSCGSTSILTLLRYRFGETDLPKSVDLAETMLDRTQEGRGQEVKKEGFSFLDLKGQLNLFGYDAVGVELPLKQMLKLRVPAIVHLELPETRHFAVWRGSYNGWVVLGDPSRGQVVYPASRFAQEWSGRTLVVAPSGEKPPKRNRSDIAAAIAEGPRIVNRLHRIGEL